MNNLIQRYLKSPRFWQLALACYWLALFIGTHIPIERLPLHQGTVDKFAHLAAFAGLAGIFAIAWRLTVGRLTITHAVWIWLVIVAYGVLEELSQPLAGRIASRWDWIADASGAALGLAVFGLLPDRWFSTAEPASEHPVRAPRRPWYRFSLKTTFILMTLAAVLLYWMVLPTVHAQRFVLAIQSKDYAAAETLFVSGSETFPGSFKEYQVCEPHADLDSMSWSDFWHGRRRINGGIRYGDADGQALCGAAIIAQRRGLKLEWWAP